MIQICKSAIALTCLIAILSCNHREEVTQYRPTEYYPEDSLLVSLKNKKAAIVTAHDDDMCAMAGTISKLNQAGWEILSVCLSNNEKDRNIAHQKAAGHLVDSIVFIDLNGKSIRNDLQTGVKAWEAIPRDKFEDVFNYQDVSRQLIRVINGFSPAVIFTLDNEIGGYGHPGHVFVSQLILDLARSGSIAPGYIYQSVYTDHMEQSIMNRHSKRMKSWGYAGDGWEKAKNTYGVEGMPEPTVQIDILSEANRKMDYLRSYNKRERKTIGFYLPAFEEYSAEEYFSIFDREFFRVIAL